MVTHWGPRLCQVAAPFGTNTGSPNPAYFAYNDECQYDSYLTVGDASSDELGDIGIDGASGFDSWTMTTALTIGGSAHPDGGAIFWMSPMNAMPKGYNAHVKLAQLTTVTGETWSAIIGTIQGKSTEASEMGDWHQSDVQFTNDGTMAAEVVAAPIQPGEEIIPCSSEFELLNIAIPALSAACCTAPGDTALPGGECEGGRLIQCTPACAAVVGPLAEDCGAFLSTYDYEIFTLFNEAAEVCASGH